MFNNLQLLRLLHLCDPALPIGGFSHSAGLETYVQAGKVYDLKTATQFAEQQLSHNLLHTDAAFVSLAFDAAASNDFHQVISMDETCTALKMPKEMLQSSNKLGIRLLKIFQADESLLMAHKYLEAIKHQEALGHYSIAFGIFANELGIEKREAITGFFYNAAAGFVTNSVKLIPLGQQDGQRILRSLFTMIEQLVEQSLSPDMNMLGACCPGFDIMCMQHEELYSRLYMS